MRSVACLFAPQSGAFCGLSLPGRAWPGPYNGPAEPFWCGRYGRAGAGGTHKCVPYRAFAAVGVQPTNRPVPHPRIWGCPDWCTRRVGAAAMPGPCRTGNSGYAPTDVHAV